MIDNIDEERSTNAHNIENYEFTNKCLNCIGKTNKKNEFNDFDTSSYNCDFEAPNFEILNEEPFYKKEINFPKIKQMSQLIPLPNLVNFLATPR